MNVGHWEYDIKQIQSLALTDDVVEFMALQIKKLPKYTQRVLKLAACIGNQFDLKMLSIVLEKSVVDTASDLWPTLHDGLVLPQTEVYNSFSEDSDTQPSRNRNFQIPKYKFVHDRVQQAAYSLIPEEEKQSTHLKIGQLLLSKIPVIEREENIFELVNQFNIAVELIVDLAERDELARMNLIAGRKALASTAYPASVKYLTIAIQLLASDSWEANYHLSLALYETAAEAAYLSGDFEQTEQFIQVVLLQAKTLLEKVKVYEVKIETYKAQGLSLGAITAGLQILNLFEVQFPEQPSQENIGIALEETQLLLAGKPIESLIDLPQMTNKRKLAVMNIIGRLLSISYISNPLLFILLVLYQVSLSLKYGNCAASALSYATYAITVWNIWGDIDSNYRLGQVALSLLEKLNIKEAKSVALFAVNSFTRHWKEHLKTSLNYLLEAYSLGLETGDIEVAAFSTFVYSEHSFWLGKELTGLETEIGKYHVTIFQLKQEIVIQLNAINWQSILNLQGFSESPCCLRGEAYDEQIMLPLLHQAGNKQALFYLHLQKSFLCYCFHDYPEAWQQAILAENYLDAVPAKFAVSIFYFYSSLAMLAVYAEANQSEKCQILEKVSNNEKRMKQWADNAPMNYLHKLYLIAAEKHRVLGQYLEAINNYDRAISLAKENEYIHEEALANELAAKFYLEWGKQKIAQTYLTDAYYGYVRWGAKAKVYDLQKRYPQLLSPILQQEQLGLHPIQKNSSSNRILLSSINNPQTVIGSRTTISDSLDLAAVIKASQALSGEIEIEQLLSTLMAVVMENAGASKCALLLSESDNLDITVTVVSSSSGCKPTTEFPSIRLESSNDVPITLINYVKRTQGILVIDDAMAEATCFSDRYFAHHQVKSLLCIPIVNQGKFIGILYLENNLTTGAFTRDRVELIKLITTQAAISLENAMLYKNLAVANEELQEYNQTLEYKVEERTQETNQKNERLKQAILELKSTQSQLIQSEKMSSLGQMVAGIAHEINNPINFIHGNINHANQYIQDLLDLISIYQQECVTPSPRVREKIEEIDLDFLLHDLPKLLDSINIGSSRIRNIVLGLRNFSRLDESEMKPVNIHEGIDNTLMILQHRLQEKSDRPEIKVIKQYGELPHITCYPGQLNQVFMNILSNAIDALDESIVIEKKGNNPIIKIRTELIDSNMVKIHIADNGLGINSEVRQKIFDPFFTTKPIGSGTGLGLSISYQIVVDKHKGQLICNSTQGKGTEFLIKIPMQ